VSQSTVSFVLNGNDNMRISAETRRRVLKAVAELGYRPRGAGARPRPRERVIGLMFDEVATSPFAAISIEGAQEEAWKAGVVVEVVMTGGDRSYEAAILRKWAADRVEGVIYASILTRQVDPPDALSRHRAVLMNCYDGDGRLPSVVPAERRGGEAATQALLDAGHRSIAFISGEPWMDASDQRMEGYERALRRAGLTVDPNLIVEGNFLPSAGMPQPTGCWTGTAGRHFLRQRPDGGRLLRGPEGAGGACRPHHRVMGYDDQEIAQHLNPPLSTILLPHREMAQWCARQLLSDGDLVAERNRMECPPVLRGSHERDSAEGSLAATSVP
jgi:LacI family transcriptional regulator